MEVGGAMDAAPTKPGAESVHQGDAFADTLIGAAGEVGVTLILVLVHVAIDQTLRTKTIRTGIKENLQMFVKADVKFAVSGVSHARV